MRASRFPTLATWCRSNQSNSRSRPGPRSSLLLSTEERRHVRLVYRGLALDRVRSAAASAGLETTLDAAGRTNRNETLRLMKRSQLLLLFSAVDPDPKSFHRRGLYPGKVFEYFGARRPILCMPGDDGQLDQLLKETHTGVICSSREEVSGFFAEAFTEWQRAGRLTYQPDEAAVARYERRAQARELASILDTTTQTSPRHR